MSYNLREFFMLKSIEKFFSLLNHKNHRPSAQKHHNCRLEFLEERTLLSVSPATAFSLHSNESAAHVIYLDFDGHTTTNTNWNSSHSLQEIETPAYSLDSDAAFSDQELDNIQEIWAYTAEYFASFDVDVTTDESSFTNNNGIRVAIGGRATDWYTNSDSTTGVAYVGSYTYQTDVPAFVFSSNCHSTYSVAVTIAHEVGHSLGLSHDSTSTQEYYPGANGWSPIMGSGNGPVQQWSKGEYTGATNKEDDLYIITTNNGFGYRPDDYGDTTSTATTLSVNGYNEFYAEGIIEQNTDSDYFKVVLTKTSDLYIKMSPSSYNCSLDTQLKLYNSSGSQIASNASTTSLSSEILVRNLAAGTYYIQAQNDGCGTFYSSYGSLGSYVLTGTVGSSAKTTVTTKADTVNANDGVISLREAIANAKAGDRIVFSKDVFSAGDVIQLDSELTISTGVIIDASDLYNETTKTPGITIKAADGCRHFTISGGTTSAPVTLQGLALVDGFTNGSGGSILASGSLTIKQCKFENNQASSTSVYTYGGAIYSQTASTKINVEDSQFIGNTADYGGVIALKERTSSINFTSSTAAGNSAVYNRGGVFYASWSCAVINVLNSVLAGNQGGAIDNYGTCNIQSSTIAGNTKASALNLGCDFNTHTIENSIIAGNYTDQKPTDAVIAGDMVINYSLIGNAQGLTLGTGCIGGTKNAVADPGFKSFTPNTGTWTKDDWKAWDLNLNRSTSIAINAGSNAKAISAFNGKLSEKTDVTGINSRLTGSVIDIGAYEQSNLIENFTGLTLSTKSPNLNETIQAIPNPPYVQVSYQWYRSSSKTSGFVLIENATASSFTPDESCLNQYLKCVASDTNGNTYSSVTDNVVRVSEKFSLAGQSVITVTSTQDVINVYDGVITLREAIAYAGELEINMIEFDTSLANKTITLTNGELVIGNSMTIDGDELGIVITTSSGRLFNVCGGNDTTPVALIGLNLTGGNVTGNGGVFLVEGTLELHSCNVYDNYASGNGGVFYSETASTHIYVFDSTLTGNEANSGGISYMKEKTARLNITSSLVAGNKANNSSAVFMATYSCAITTLLNSAIIGNKAYNYGVGYSYGQVLVYNSTIAGNIASSYAGAIYFGSGRDTHKIENSIIALNTAGSAESDIEADETVTVNNSLIGNGDVTNLVSGSGNYIGNASSVQNPGFVSLNTVTAGSWTKNTWQNWNYSLSSNSVAVNAGSNSLAYTAFGVTSNAEMSSKRDLQGKPRIINDVIDMGACEYGNMTVLSKPSLNTPVVNDKTVSVSWSSVSGASRYSFEYKLSTDSTWTTQNVTGTSSTFTGSSGLTYDVRVKAVGSGSYADSDYAVTSVTIPAIDNVGDTFSNAKAITFTNDAFTFTDKLGEGTSGLKDVDIYKLVISSSDIGRRYTFTTSKPAGGTAVDTYIRLFDSISTQLAYNDDGGDGNYSSLTWTPSAAGTYYLGVSSYDNKDYNPTSAGSSTSNGTQGDYTLTVTRTAKLSTPTLNASVIDSRSISVTVGSVSNASGYTLQYSTNQNFANATTMSVSPGTTTISSLSENTTYYIRVMATGTGNYSNSDYATKSVKTPGKLSAPSLSLTTNGTNAIDVTVGSVANASGYTLEYSTNSNFSNSVTRSVSAGTMTISGLNENTWYYFRVMATGTGDYCDSNYTSKSAKTASKLPAPSLSVIANGANAINVTVGAVSNASGYTLQYSTNSNFTNATTMNVSAGTRTISSLNENTTYYFRVMATGSGNYCNSDYSVTKSVKTPSKLLAPSLSVNTLGPKEIDVTVGSVANASGYSLQYSTNQDFSNATTKSVSAGTSTVGGLRADTTYYFRVMATGTGSYSNSDFSLTRSAKTDEPDDTEITINGKKVTISWEDGSPMPDAVRYRVANGSTKWTTKKLKAGVTSYTFSGAVGKDYEIQVLLDQQETNILQATAVVLDQPKLKADKAYLKDDTFQVNVTNYAAKNLAANATQAILTVNGVQTKVDIQYQQGSAALANGGYVTFNNGLFTFTDMNSNTAYKVQVAFTDGLSVSTPSSNLSVKTTKACYETPTLTSATAISDTAISVTWTSVNGKNSPTRAQTYTIQYSLNGKKWTNATTKATGNSYTIQKLKGGNEYRIRVLATKDKQFEASAVSNDLPAETLALPKTALDKKTMTSSSFKLNVTNYYGTNLTKATTLNVLSDKYGTTSINLQNGGSASFAYGMTVTFSNGALTFTNVPVGIQQKLQINVSNGVCTTAWSKAVSVKTK